MSHCLNLFLLGSAASSMTLTVGSSIFSSADLGKSIAVPVLPTPVPALPSVMLSTAAGGNFSAGTVVFYRITEVVPNASGPAFEGPPSLEGYVKASSNGSQLVIQSPTALSGAMGWNVYAAESDTSYSGVTLARVSGTVMQATTTANNGLYVGQTFVVSGAGTDYNGIFQVASVIDSKNFTYYQGGGTTSSTGTVIPDPISGTEALQTNAGTGCSMSYMVTPALPTGQAKMCMLGSGVTWTSPATSLTVGTVRPPALNTSYPKANTGTCGTSGLCQSGSSVTVQTVNPHGLLLGQQFYLSGAAPSAYNGWYKVTMVSNPQKFMFGWSGGTLSTGGGGVIQPSSVLISTIITQTGSTATLADASWAPAGSSGNQVLVTWATDDTAAIQNAINTTGSSPLCSAPDGCTIFFPHGSYWVQHVSNTAYALTIPQGSNNFVRLVGAGFAGDKSIGGGNVGPGLSNATSQLVSADPVTPIVAVGMGSTSLNAGPLFENLGFRDVSGACASPGGLLFQNVARSRVENVSFREFCNGYAIRYDGSLSGAPGGVNQFNLVNNVTAIDVQSGVEFGNGMNYDNWIQFGTFYHSQTGGGICVDFQSNQGSNSGGTNFIMPGSCNFFPVAVRLIDQHADYIGAKAENTSLGGNNVVGGLSTNTITGPTYQSGVGIQIEGSPAGSSTPAPCKQNRLISPVLGEFDVAISLGANCASDLVIARTYSAEVNAGYYTEIVDSGSGDIILDHNGLTFGAGTSGAGGHINQASNSVAGSSATNTGGTASITFVTPYNSAPLCVVSAVGTAGSVYVNSTLSTYSTLVVGSSPGSVNFNYLCVGNPN